MAARLRRWWSLASLAALVALIAVPLAEAKTANTPQAPIKIGRIWMNPEYDGAEGWSGSQVQYPAGIPLKDYTDMSNQIKRGWIGTGQKTGTWLMTTDWTDPASTTHEYTSSYFFRSMDYTYPLEFKTGTAGATFNYLYPGNIQEIYRWARPTIIIRNALTSSSADTTVEVKWFPGEGTPVFPDNAGSGPRPAPKVDPNLVTEMAVELWWRHIQGVEYSRTDYAYPHGSAHQDYVLQDITMKNNGISGVTPTAPVLANQTINNMVWSQGYDYRNNNAPTGSQIGKDVDGEFIEPWGSPGHDAIILWDGDDQTTGGNAGPDWGDPAEDSYYLGHLLGNATMILGSLFTSAGPGANYAVDDTTQPAFKLVWRERGLDFAGQPYSPADPEAMRSFLTSGDYAIPLRTLYRDDPVTSDIVNYDQGPTVILGYGPVGADVKSHGWDLAFNDSVRIVQVWAAGGIDVEAAREIGVKWLDRKTSAPTAPETWMDAADIALVQTGRDTAMKAAALAYWNMYGEFAPNVTAADLAKWGIPNYAMAKVAAYDQPYNVPEAPRPPGTIITRQHPAGGIEVRWTKEAETSPDFDTNVMDGVSYRVYRQVASRTAPWELMGEMPFASFRDAAAEGDLPAGRVIVDNDVVQGQSYWYAVTVVDDGTQNWAEPGKKLESSRWYTWTGFQLLGTVAGAPNAVAGDGPAAFVLAQNVPNPFNPATTINFSLPQAGDAKLAIYNTNGQLIRTLVNGNLNAGSHQVVWDGMDQQGRPSASGVYVYRLTSASNVMSKRMVLVR